jgi:hypothetical protein
VSQIDLNNPPPKHQFSVSVEREETEGERRVRLFKEVAIFSAALVFVAIMAWVCLSTLQSASAAPDEKKWAMSVLSAATGGLIGFLIRK